MRRMAWTRQTRPASSVTSSDVHQDLLAIPSSFVKRSPSTGAGRSSAVPSPPSLNVMAAGCVEAFPNAEHEGRRQSVRGDHVDQQIGHATFRFASGIDRAILLDDHPAPHFRFHEPGRYFHCAGHGIPDFELALLRGSCPQQRVNQGKLRRRLNTFSILAPELVVMQLGSRNAVTAWSRLSHRNPC